MAQDSHESDADRAVSLSDESTVPTTRLGMARPAAGPCGLDPEDEPLEPLKVSADSGGDLEKRMDDCTFDIRNMWKRLDLALRKQEKTDSIRRGQIDSISARIYEAERNMSQVEERQEKALEKASSTFQKQNANLVRVVGQVNMNFEQLSAEIDRQSARLRTVEAASEQLSSSLSMVTFDSQNTTASMEDFKQSFKQNHAASVESFRQGLLALEQSLAQQQRQLDGSYQKLEQQTLLAQQQCRELKSGMEPMADTLVRLATQTKSDERLQGAEEQLAAICDWVRSTQARHHELARGLASVQQEVAVFSHQAREATHRSREAPPVEPFLHPESDQGFRDCHRDPERLQSLANIMGSEDLPWSLLDHAPMGAELSLRAPPVPRRLARDLEDMAQRHRNARDADDEQDLRAAQHSGGLRSWLPDYERNDWHGRNDWHAGAPDGHGIRHPEASGVPVPTMSSTGVSYGL
jgi:predicted  nucleic acid-binding Zn-ribbon protein